MAPARWVPDCSVFMHSTTWLERLSALQPSCRDQHAQQLTCANEGLQVEAAALDSFGCVQEVERAKLLERLGKWKGEALQQLLDVFDTPTPSKGTKVWTTTHVLCTHEVVDSVLAASATHEHLPVDKACRQRCRQRLQ